MRTMQLTSPEPRVADDDVDVYLWRRIQEGDEEALGSLFDRWVDRVYSIASHSLGDPDEADAAVEQTFRKVWKEARQYGCSGGSVGSRIILIARTTSLSRQRTAALPTPDLA